MHHGNLAGSRGISASSPSVRRLYSNYSRLHPQTSRGLSSAQSHLWALVSVSTVWKCRAIRYHRPSTPLISEHLFVSPTENHFTSGLIFIRIRSCRS
ncbi:hypothetical protein B0H19DRAFT_1092220 [Mycena capillaripes]|nr:hypothetical protein B0H19DRAFT_1092220 [Mycena capillaripes]